MTRSLRYLRHFTAGSLLFSALLVVALSPTPAAVAACAVAGVLYVRALYARPGSWVLRLMPVGAVAAVIVTAQDPRSIWPTAAVPAVVTTGAMICTRWPRLPIAGIGLAVTGVTVVLATRDWPAALIATGATFICVSALMAQFWVWEVAVQVDRDRVRGAVDAVDRERQRFAADLHDIQGHNLQAIVLKSELAARLVAVDPGRAAAEMSAVEELARRTLAETRSVAHGYREVSFETELANAVGLLKAGGVRCHTDLVAYDDVRPEVRRLLALLVREATTNVLRHSDADKADITLAATADEVRLTVRNNNPLARLHGDGQGLTGLAERFTAAGGRLRWASSTDCFEVEAALPRTPGEDDGTGHTGHLEIGRHESAANSQTVTPHRDRAERGTAAP
ncbi:histidine kinase [Actinoplanes sp. NBRC 103695]|uniref:sensor histidine kinase n=1 Tax=Actinoplanes sp. NBRC 103695 TaxID=3032202 RepID=UPI0024A28DFA|nr:histidine kinase [Actinoplanes sp. NBRC 103695]GLZ01689.1 hypothetical protein Acsp02_89400 [Actinoplanes sp. NBRC 103695]